MKFKSLFAIVAFGFCGVVAAFNGGWEPRIEPVSFCDGATTNLVGVSAGSYQEGCTTVEMTNVYECTPSGAQYVTTWYQRRPNPGCV
jgi:hypothetical protein